MSSAFGALVTIESEHLPIRPPQMPKSFDQDASRERPVPALEFGDVEMLPIPISGRSSVSRDRIENVDEAQHGSSYMDRDNQRQGPISDQVQTIWYPYKNRFRVMAACLTAMANGMNDSAPGALIASLERYGGIGTLKSRTELKVCRDYNIAYGTVSIIFVCNALGFVAAAFFISVLSSRIGRAKCLMISEALLILGYTAIVTTPPFPVVCAS
jgi:hypothetical protein